MGGLRKRDRGFDLFLGRTLQDREAEELLLDVVLLASLHKDTKRTVRGGLAGSNGILSSIHPSRTPPALSGARDLTERRGFRATDCKIRKDFFYDELI